MPVCKDYPGYASLHSNYAIDDQPIRRAHLLVDLEIMRLTTEKQAILRLRESLLAVGTRRSRGALPTLQYLPPRMPALSPQESCRAPRERLAYKA